jgi:prevent-host-death family protein
MTSEMPVTQAREELADLINRVAYGRERIILTRHSKPVAGIVPPEDLVRLEERDEESPNLPYTGIIVEKQHLAVDPGPMPIAAQHRPPPQPSR